MDSHQIIRGILSSPIIDGKDKICFIDCQDLISNNYLEMIKKYIGRPIDYFSILNTDP
jgi:hypothetical protein